MAAVLQSSLFSQNELPRFRQPWKPSRPPVPLRAVSFKNIISINISNISINSQQVCQQTSSGPAIASKTHGVSAVLEEPRNENGSGGHGSKGGLPPSGGGDGGEGGFGGGTGEDDEDFDEEELGPIMKYEDVMREAEMRGTNLPSDMVEAAKTVGIRRVIFRRYLDLQTGTIWPLGFLTRSCSTLRNRMLADPSFLSKVMTEVIADSCCATFVELQKKHENFWSEFKLFTADILPWLIADIALVTMLAPSAHMSPMPSVSGQSLGHLQLDFASLPSSVFEAGSQGFKFSWQQRIAAYFYKGFLSGAVGFGCGLTCHGMVNLIMFGNRNTKKSEEQLKVLLYGIINGLEQLVQSSPLAKQVPSVALAFTVGIRFTNNIYGRLQFADWAK